MGSQFQVGLRTMKLFLLLLPSLSLAQQPQQLKPNMLGKFQLETSEGFTAYMTELGVNVFTRLIACSLYPTATNEQKGPVITIKTSSTFTSTETHFSSTNLSTKRPQTGGM